MTDINKVTIVGRLCKDAEYKSTTTGLSVVRFSIANTFGRKVGDKWQEEANYFDCVFLGTRAEGIHRYLTKGRQIAISGELRQQRWEQDGQTRTKVEIIVNELQLFAAPQNQNSSPAPKSAPAQPGPETFTDDDDDVIPF